MTYQELQEWLNELKAANPNRKDVKLAISAIESILAKPLVVETRYQLLANLRQLIRIDIESRIQYPDRNSTAGIVLENLQKPSKIKAFEGSYPQIAIKALVEQDEVADTSNLPASTGTKRPIALLDIDHTLLFDDRFNENLLASLKKNGIKDVYLFTDMRFRKLHIEERLTLMQTLRDKGFVVHGIITPLDLIWQHMNDMTWDNIQTLYQALQNHRGRYTGEKFLTFMESLQNDFPVLSEVQNYSVQDCQPGSSFEQAKAAFNTIAEAPEETPMPDNMLERSNLGKILVDWLAERAGFAHNKALMLDLFMQHKPAWVSSVLIADDHPHVIQSIDQYKESRNPTLPISSITVTSNELEVSDYDEAIDAHFSSDPQFTTVKTIESRIDQHIAALEQSTWNIFLTSPEAKKQALEALKSNLRESFNSREPVSINTVIEDWEKSLKFIDRLSNNKVPIAKVLSQHRNIFRSEFREEETGTQGFIRSLKKEFGAITLNPPELENLASIKL